MRRQAPRRHRREGGNPFRARLGPAAGHGEDGNLPASPITGPDAHERLPTFADTIAGAEGAPA